MRRAVVHVIGAGAGGLSAARALVTTGACDVVLHEAQPFPGGRRRSFPDETLACEFDTGAFALLSGWTSTLDLIETVGALGEWRTEPEPGVAFADFATGERWRLRPNTGRWPWWLVNAKRRGPNLRLSDYWAARRLLSVSAEATVASIAPKGAGFERLWRPLTLAALNCPPEIASARLLGALYRETIEAGGAGLRLLTPNRGIGRALIEPIARNLERNGATLRYGRRLMGLTRGPDRITSLEFEHDRIDLDPIDGVVLATPWAVTAGFAPGAETPEPPTAALTIHYAVSPPPAAPGVLGALNGPFDWLFAAPDRISVTLKNAGSRLEAPREKLAGQCWRAVAALMGFSDAPPAWRIAASRRAAALATPAETARRPLCRTEWRNLFLAGGHVGRDLPDSLENAVRSGATAARAWLERSE
jgi:phytoene dehydrogenase-like protein